MASPRHRADLASVQINPRFTRLVRAPAARYGDPVPRDDSFPAEAVLRDLVTADRVVAPLITARYAALRFWLLYGTGGDAELLDHGRDAAAEHLACAGEAEEVVILSTLVDRPEPLRDAVALLERAAELAEARRCPHGAGALRESAFHMAVHHMDFGLAARVAGDIGRRLRRSGRYRVARRWDRAAAALAAREHALSPPSAE